MEELIGLIIQLIAKLFDSNGKSARPTPLPPPRQGAAPPDIDMYRAIPASRRSQGVQTKQAGTVGNRVGLKLAMQVPIRRQAMVNMKRMPPRSPQLQRTVAALQQMGRPPAKATPPATSQVHRTVTTTNAPAHPVSPINADSVRKLIRNKPAALRTIFTLTELMGKPVGLRDD